MSMIVFLGVLVAHFNTMKKNIGNKTAKIRIIIKPILFRRVIFG